MTEDRILHVLEEIRDLQKQHLEKYDAAVQNQSESIALQKRAVRRQLIIPLSLLALIAIVVAALLLLQK